MARKLDRLLVIDVEATCWDGPPPTGQEPEIIEIGICAVDIRTGERVDRQSILVQPEHSHVSPFCTKLTTLTQRQVNDGVSFERACTILQRKFKSRQRIWASYGDYDRCQFQKQCHERGIDYPFSGSHINVKSMLALVRALPYEIGLLKALDLLDLPVEGVHHRGVDDAWNTGLILSKLLLQRRVMLAEPLQE
ncbi:MAG: exonuclease domain-containing protein [Chloroflexi bacterium]|nr:exonuclease domain-containing protein [Chloroflexota bacterium]